MEDSVGFGEKYWEHWDVLLSQHDFHFSGVSVNDDLHIEFLSIEDELCIDLDVAARMVIHISDLTRSKCSTSVKHG